MDSTLTAVLYPALNRAADENRFVIPVDGWLRVRAKKLHRLPDGHWLTQVHIKIRDCTLQAGLRVPDPLVVNARPDLL